MLQGIAGDLRRAARSLRAAPAVTIAAILTLTLGIGATTAIFSVANGLALRPLPVKEPQSLVTITSGTALRYGFKGGAGWSFGMWDQLRQRSGAFDGALAWSLQRLDLSEGGEMQPASVLIASGGFFDVLGVPAVIGRTFHAADDVPGGGPDGAVAVISHSLWQRRFGARQDVRGSRLLIEQVPVTIVGVAPEWFRGVEIGQHFDVALPFGTDALVRGRRSFVNNENALVLLVMLRLKSGQSVPSATAALRTMQPQILSPDAPEFLKEPFVLVDASRGVSDRLRQQYVYPLVILSIVSGIVLVIVCFNIANLLLSRASARRPEDSIRLALGAPRWRLGRQYFVEAGALAAVGTLGGVLFASWANRPIVSQLPSGGGPVSIDLSMDWRVFAFTAGLAVLAVVVFGTAPALYAARVAPIEAMRDAGRGVTGGRTGLLSGSLLIAQVALSIVLLAGAVMFVRTLNQLIGVPLGFDPSGMLVVSVNSARSKIQSADGPQSSERRLEAVMSVAGVLKAAGSVWTPVGTGGGGLLTDARGRRLETDARGRRVESVRRAAFNFVTPGWFATYRTDVKMGRDFEITDGPTAPRVAIVNETLYRSLMAEGQTLGGTIPCGNGTCTIVGVVADAVYGQSLRDAAPPTVYMPFAQSAGVGPPNAPFRISLRADGSPAGLMSRLAARLRDVDPGLTFSFRSPQQDLDASVAQERIIAMLSGFFAVIALMLCVIGLYGVSSYAVSRRVAEIGIRLALGAKPHAVVRAMLGRIALFIVAGAGLGIGTTLWLSRFVAPLLYGLEPQDPLVLLGSALGLAMVALLAGAIPVWRATRIDPAQVLRDV